MAASVCALVRHCYCNDPEIKVHGANMGPIWGRQDPGGPHVGPMIFAIWGVYFMCLGPYIIVDVHYVSHDFY